MAESQIIIIPDTISQFFSGNQLSKIPNFPYKSNRPAPKFWIDSRRMAPDQAAEIGEALGSAIVGNTATHVTLFAKGMTSGRGATRHFGNEDRVIEMNHDYLTNAVRVSIPSG